MDFHEIARPEILDAGCIEWQSLRTRSRFMPTGKSASPSHGMLGQLDRGRPCGKCSVAVATRSQDSSPHNLFRRRGRWPREVRIGEAGDRNPVDVGVPIALPKDVAACPFRQPVPLSGAAAIRAEMKADLEAAVGISLLILARIPLSR
jgi:hypothetical protein